MALGVKKPDQTGLPNTKGEEEEDEGEDENGEDMSDWFDCSRLGIDVCECDCPTEWVRAQ